MNNSMITIGKNLKALRIENGYTQESIAQFLDVDQTLISKFESGDRNMSIDMMEKLAVLFGIPEASFSDVNLEIKKVSRSFRANGINDEDLHAIYAISKIYENIKYMDVLIEEKKDINDVNEFLDNIKLYLNKDERTKAEILRKELGEDIYSPIDTFSIIKSLNYTTTIFYPMGERLSGICIKDPKNLVIGINSQMTLGRQHFSIAHELFHAFCESDVPKSISFRNIGTGNVIEKKADKFASYFLIPHHSLYQELKKRDIEKISLKNIIDLEQFYGVSRKAILYRLEEEKIISKKEADNYSKSVRISAIYYGYDDSLYRELPQEKQYMTYGKYIRQANKLLENKKISSGKYEELLLDAFRSDIVFGESIEGNENVD